MLEEQTQMTEKKTKTKSEKVLFIIGIVLVCIMVPILILDSIMLIKSVVDKEHVPSIFGTKPLVIQSGSMEPGIEKNDPIYKNDLIFVDYVDIEAEMKTSTLAELNAKWQGKTVAYKDIKSNGEWEVIVHRVREIKEANKNADGTSQTASGYVFITYGINTGSNDRFAVDPANIEGVWDGSRIGGVGAFVGFLQTWYGILIFIGVPLTAIIVYDVITTKNYNKKQADAKNAELQAELDALKTEKEALQRESQDSQN